MTNTNTIAMVSVSGVTVEEFVAFVMDRKAGMTHEVINAELSKLGVKCAARATKAEKAQVWFEAAKSATIAESATDESSVAEVEVVSTKSNQNNSEEEVTMTNVIKANTTKAGIVVNTGNTGKALPAPSETLNTLGLAETHGHANAAIDAMIEKVTTAKDKYFKNIGEYEVEVVGITFYPEKSEATNQEIRDRKVVTTNQFGQTFLGEVSVRVPAGYAQIRLWDAKAPNNKGGLGAMVWTDFVDADLNVVGRKFDARRALAEGTGIITLPIKEGKDGRPFVNLPVQADRKVEGRFWPVFQTADVRFAKTKDAVVQDQPMYLPTNNDWFNAQVTAFIQLFTNEFEQANVKNRHDFNASCRTCAHAIVLGTKDGVTDDMDMESKKSRMVLEQPDVMQLAQVGPEQPSVVCGIDGQFKDIDAILFINKATQEDRVEYQDENGNWRRQAADEIMVAGKPVKVADYRANATKATCMNCPFYTGNAPKSEAQVAKEKVEAREAGKTDYVSPFYRTRPMTNRQAVQTQVEVGKDVQWVTAFPGEVIDSVDDIKSVRVKSAGLTVTGSPEVVSYMDPEFVAETEEFDARHAEVMNQINQIFYAAFNFDKLTENQADIIFDLVDNKPEGLTSYEDTKWDNATFWFGQSLVWAQERAEARNIAPFATKFFTEYKEGAEELTVEMVMGDAIYRNEQGSFGYGLGYADLNAEEFVRHLDENVLNYVYDVIVSGKEFYITVGNEESFVNGTQADVELAAQALQIKLQREINSTWIYGARRAENPAEAIAEFRINDDVKAYVKSIVVKG